MLIRFLKRLFGWGGDHAAAPGATMGTRSSVKHRNAALLDEFAPLKDAEPVIPYGQHAGVSGHDSAAPAEPLCEEKIPPAETVQSFVCRESVLDRSGHVAGYEFMLRKKVHPETRAVFRLYDEVLLRNIIAMGIGRLLANRLAFVCLCAASLGKNMLKILPAKGMVLVIHSSSELLDQREEAYASLQALKSEGFRIGLEDFQPVPEMEAFLQLADYAVIDVSLNDLQQLNQMVDFLSGRFPDAQLVAKNVDSLESYDVCRNLQFDYFQGSFLTRVDEQEQPKVSASHIRVFELLNLVQKDASGEALAKTFKLDPMLTYKLLRYINSPGGGLVAKVTTLEHAIAVLGQQKLYRWLTLLLFGSGTVNARDWALMENALVRGRLTEMFGREAFSPDEQDKLFIVGFFSLLDVLLRMPMGDALAQLNLPDELVNALVHEQGKYAPFLELAIACEQADQGRITALAAECGLDVLKVNVAHIEAMLWALEVENQT